MPGGHAAAAAALCLYWAAWAAYMLGHAGFGLGLFP